MPESLYLIDGHAQIYRCYYAPFRELSAPSGEPTKATYVFCQMLLSLYRQRRPDYLAMVIDTAEIPLFRADLLATYKANRPPPPEDLAPQKERILQILEAIGVPVLSAPGYEADDVIATIVHQLADEDLEIFLVSRDKDLEQLLSDRVRLYDAHKDEVIGPAELKAQKGLAPEQVVDALALMGDVTDNVPGVPGIGPKTAAKLINKYGSAEAVVEHADELSPKLARNVRAFAPNLALAKELVRLRDDAPVSLRLEDARFRGLPVEVLRPIFEELGFFRLLEQLQADESSTDASGQAGGAQAAVAKPAADAGRYELVDRPDKLADLADQLARQPAFALDTETTGLNPVAADLVGIAFSWRAGQGYYVPVRAAVGDVIPLQQVRERLGPILADPRIKKCGQNLKYDLVVLRCAGMEVNGVDFDTLVASALLDAGRESHRLDRLAAEVLGYKTTPLSDLIGKGRGQVTLDQLDTKRVCQYAAEDADIAWRLKEVFAPRLKDAGLDELFCRTEMPLVEVLAEMEYNGVALDTAVLAQMSNALADRLSQLSRRIYEYVGHEFNIDSTKQLSEVLFDELKLRVVKKTKTGRSTDAETLAVLAWETNHPVPRLVLEYRELSKLKSTYVDALPEAICEKTGRVHASFHQTGTSTGRLSSSDPNLQNIPIRTDTGRQIRRAFVPGRKDHVLLTADYSQIELRVLAHFCRDEALLNAFYEDKDIHAFVASQVFDVPIDAVTREQRARAKAVNFGIIYGQTPYGLSRQTGMSVTEARQFIARYFRRYPGIQRFVDECIDQVKRCGFVQTILGRRRRIEGIHSRNRQRAALAARLAVNTVVQGSAADLIKQAMVNIHRRIKQERRPSRMLIQVHDELVFELPREAVEAEAEMIRHEMTSAIPLNVPIRVDLAWGPNWLEAK